MDNKMKIFLVCLLYSLGLSDDLLNKVSYYEKLHSTDLRVFERRKRDADGKYADIKQILFSALGINFRLLLYPGTPVLSSNFVAKTVTRSGKVDNFYVDINNFLTGHIENNSSVHVDAYFEEGVFGCSIHWHNDTYIVEPAWRHLHPSENYTMIAYRASDVYWQSIFTIDPSNTTRTSGNNTVQDQQQDTGPGDQEQNLHNTQETVSGYSKRHHRSETPRKSCSLLVVADYFFYTDIGGSRRSSTAAFIISRLRAADSFLRRTEFADEKSVKFSNIGVHVEEMLIYTDVSNETKTFNSHGPWQYEEFLSAFGELKAVSKHCLGYLFTSHTMQDGVLGLSYIAQASGGGGICRSSATRKYNKISNRNVGFITAKNSLGVNVLTSQLDGVLAHGHSFGSDHDPDTSECHPDRKKGGPYLMHYLSTTSYEPNNFYFSPCSTREIAKVLQKRITCLKDLSKPQSLCGNGIIEDKEQCDSGFTDKKDPCCNEAGTPRSCQLKSEASCSDSNHACCVGCKTASRKTRCQSLNNLTCTGEAFCDGQSLECPTPPSLPDSSPCLDGGICMNGTCLNTCDRLGLRLNKQMKPCLCTENAIIMCHQCCSEIITSTENEIAMTEEICFSTNESMRPGRTCHWGFCTGLSGRQLKEKHLYKDPSVKVLWKFVTRFLVTVQFMKTNIVTSVVLLCFIVWVPVSLFISFQDEIQREKTQHQCLIRQKKSVLNTFYSIIRAGSERELASTEIKQQLQALTRSTKSGIGINPMDYAVKCGKVKHVGSSVDNDHRALTADSTVQPQGIVIEVDDSVDQVQVEETSGLSELSQGEVTPPRPSMSFDIEQMAFEASIYESRCTVNLMTAVLEENLDTLSDSISE